VSELAQVIIACATLVTAIAGATATLLVALRNTNKKVEAVMAEVVTANEATIGQLAASIETVRIEAKEAAGKPLTAQEQRHIDASDSAKGSF